MTQTSNLSPGEQFLRRSANTPRPKADANGRPTQRFAYTYDEQGKLIKAEPVDE